MTEQNDQPIQQEAEGQVESKIASKFQAAREATMNESAQLSEIYRSITKPGFKDVYSAWVKNMDTVANSYSWGKDKQTLKTKIIKIQNRVVGTVAAGLTVPTDFFVDIATLPFRKLPILKQTIGHFIPTHDIATQIKHTCGEFFHPRLHFLRSGFWRRKIRIIYPFGEVWF